MIESNGLQIVNRIDELLSKQGKKRPDLCAAVGLPPSTLSKWSLRGTVPSADLLLNIADYLKVDIRYLVTGQFSNNNNKIDVTPEELHLLSDFNLLDKFQRDGVFALIRSLLISNQYKEAEIMQKNDKLLQVNNLLCKLQNTGVNIDINSIKKD